MKVRLGNDIQLKLNLRFQDTNANVWSAQAFFINTTLRDKIEAEYKKKHRFIGRFPIEPFVDEFQPTAYNINSCGQYPKYKAFVINDYLGFGYKPNWEKCMPIKDVDITTYRSNVEITQNSQQIVVTFPAEAQLHEGVYELVVTAKIYDNGYKNNERVVTANYKNVFELVTDSQDDATDNPVQIELNNQ